MIPATLSLSPNRLAALEPWDLEELKPYDPAFLSGFKAQRYQVDLAEGFERAKEIIAPAIESDVRTDIGGDEQTIESLSTDYYEVTFKHLLLPVYAGAYRYNGKLFQIWSTAARARYRATVRTVFGRSRCWWSRFCFSY